MFNDDLHADAQALLPGRTTEAGATRRTALQAALGLGYAAAAAPSWRRRPLPRRQTA